MQPATVTVSSPDYADQTTTLGRTLEHNTGLSVQVGEAVVAATIAAGGITEMLSVVVALIVTSDVSFGRKSWLLERQPCLTAPTAS